MEFVYVVERKDLFDLHYPQGLVLWNEQREEVERYLTRIREHGFFLERRKAELDNRFQQIIPYVMVCRGDQIFLLERTSQQSERRLHGKRSIGIGGHINPEDDKASLSASDTAPGPRTAPTEVLVRGLYRELDEELHCTGRLQIRAAGFLNDDSTPVGAVHFGFVAIADVEQGEVTVRETDMMTGRFVSATDLRALYQQEPERFETWSGRILERLPDVLASELSVERALGASCAK